jgi:hypothetical protein
MLNKVVRIYQVQLMPNFFQQPSIIHKLDHSFHSDVQRVFFEIEVNPRLDNIKSFSNIIVHIVIIQKKIKYFLW